MAADDVTSGGVDGHRRAVVGGTVPGLSAVPAVHPARGPVQPDRRHHVVVRRTRWQRAVGRHLAPGETHYDNLPLPINNCSVCFVTDVAALRDRFLLLGLLEMSVCYYYFAPLRLRSTVISLLVGDMSPGGCTVASSVVVVVVVVVGVCNLSQMRSSKWTYLIFGVSIGLDPC